MSVKLGTVVIDCADPAALADFWCQVLEWHIIDRDDDGAVEIGARDQQHVTLLFEPVEEPKHIKNRLHVDLNPGQSIRPIDRTRPLARAGRPAR